MKRAGIIILAAALALFATAGVLLAQDAPPPPHQFFGSADAGSGARLDGQLAPDGTIVSAFNENGLKVGEAVITDGTWLIQIDPRDATSVTFTVGDSLPSAPFNVVSRSLTEAFLGLVTSGGGVDDGANDLPEGFPESPDGMFEVIAEVDTDFPDSSATLLRDGTVLYAGEGTAAIFDPMSGTMTMLDAPAELRRNHTATLLQDGSVLLTGGATQDLADDTFSTFADAVLYDPESASFTVLGPMTTPRFRHSATLLADGRVLIIGGVTISGPVDAREDEVLASVEIYDPRATDAESAALRSATFSPAGSLNTPRWGHSTTLRGGGDGVVVVGGFSSEGRWVPGIEIFDPATGESRAGGATQGSLGFPHSAFALSDGNILLVDGSRLERYDPETGFTSVVASDDDLPFPGFGARAVLLQDGRVLLVGGADRSATNIIPRATFIDIETGEASVGPALNEPRAVDLLVTPLLDGTILVAGGFTGEVFANSVPVSTIELFTGPLAVLPRFPAPPTQEFALGPGFNLAGWLGATAVEEATASIAGQFDSIFRWDAAQGSFASFRAQGPAFLNDLGELTFGDAFWIFVSDPNGATWEQPIFTAARAVELLTGLNLVLWTGPDGMSVEEAFAGILAELVSVATWDGDGFLTFRPDAPSFVNTAETLR